MMEAKRSAVRRSVRRDENVMLHIALILLLAGIFVSADGAAAPEVDSDQHHPKATMLTMMRFLQEEACCDPAMAPDCSEEAGPGADCCFGGYWACPIAGNTYCNLGDPTDGPLFADVCETTESPTTSAPPTVTASPTRPPSPPEGCLICGDGKVVTAPDAIFSFPAQPSFSCGVLEDAGLSGMIPVESCRFLPGLIDVCECMPGDPPPSTTQAPVTPTTSAPLAPPTPAPVLSPTPAPIIPPTPAPIAPVTLAPVPPPTPVGPSTPCPDVPSTGCSVCGEGMCVTFPNDLFVFPGQPITKCSVLQEAGYNGTISIDQCPFVPNLILSSGSCGCGSSVPGMPVTNAPVATPTPVISDPTMAPVTAPPASPPPVVAPPVETPPAMPSSKGDGMGMGKMGSDPFPSPTKKPADGGKGGGMGMRRTEYVVEKGFNFARNARNPHMSSKPGVLHYRSPALRRGIV